MPAAGTSILKNKKLDIVQMYMYTYVCCLVECIYIFENIKSYIIQYLLVDLYYKYRIVSI